MQLLLSKDCQHYYVGLFMLLFVCFKMGLFFVFICIIQLFVCLFIIQAQFQGRYSTLERQWTVFLMTMMRINTKEEVL